MEAKKKYKSVIYEQKQLLIDFVHKHPKLNTKKFGPSYTIKDSQMLWQNITSRYAELDNWTKKKLGLNGER